MYSFKNLFVFIFLLFTGLSTFAQVKKFPPRDESGKVASLKTFVDSLKTIVAKKDSKALALILHPEIKFDFDTGEGADKFLAFWKPESKSSQFWHIAKTIIDMGGVFGDETPGSLYEFVFPYVNKVDLDDSYDYFKTLVVIEKDVKVYQRPDQASSVIGILSYDVVRIDPEKAKAGWTFVETSDKKITGFMEESFAWSPIDYRMYLTREKGRWMISCLVSGD